MTDSKTESFEMSTTLICILKASNDFFVLLQYTLSKLAELKRCKVTEKFTEKTTHVIVKTGMYFPKLESIYAVRVLVSNIRNWCCSYKQRVPINIVHGKIADYLKNWSD